MITAAAATTAVAGLLQVKDARRRSSRQPGDQDASRSTLPTPGSAADDPADRLRPPCRRAVPAANTDTMLLVRLNAASSTINVMSIPRDLEVDIPGFGIAKINAAYSDGGYGLLIKTISANVFPNLQRQPHRRRQLRRLLGPRRRDRLRLLRRRPPLLQQHRACTDNYSSIDIQPGYQKLCGDNQSVNGALPFVRFRHTDSDIVREARQQDFIRWAKDQYSIGRAARQPRPAAADLRQALDAGQEPAVRRRAAQPVRPRAQLRRPARSSRSPFPADLQPCAATSLLRDRQPAAEQAAFARFMTPTPKAGDGRRQHGARRRRPRSRATSGWPRSPPRA